MFKYYCFEDGTIVNLYGVDSVRRYDEAVPVEYNYSPNKASTAVTANEPTYRIRSVLEIVESGHAMKLFYIDDDDAQAFVEALKQESNGIVNKNTIKVAKTRKRSSKGES